MLYLLEDFRLYRPAFLVIQTSRPGRRAPASLPLSP